MSDSFKPGDVVRHEPSGETWTVAFVRRGSLYWCGWPPGCVDLDDVTLVKASSPEREREIIEQCDRIQEAGDARYRWAHAEMLRRGWRELDREDVTERQWGVEIFVGDARIGDLVRGTASWQAWWIELVGDEVKRTDLGHWPSFDDARDALIAAENARRAKETPHA